MGRVRDRRSAPEGLAAICREILTSKGASARIKVYFARGYFSGSVEVGPGLNLHDAARQRLVEALADPDWIARAGACYGLAESGEGAREAAAIEPLRQDPDEVVREAAEYALKKIRGEAR